MRIINPKTHGIIDYLSVIFLFASPTIFNLPSTTATFTYILGSIHLLLTLGTDFPPGVFKIVPLKIHGWIELLVSIVLVGAAFYLGSIDGSIAKIFYLCFAVALFITWLLTDYKKAVARQ